MCFFLGGGGVWQKAVWATQQRTYYDVDFAGVCTSDAWHGVVVPHGRVAPCGVTCESGCVWCEEGTPDGSAVSTETNRDTQP